MESEIILKTFQAKLKTQRYANNTIKSYVDYANLFLKNLETTRFFTEGNS